MKHFSYLYNNNNRNRYRQQHRAGSHHRQQQQQQHRKQQHHNRKNPFLPMLTTEKDLENIRSELNITQSIRDQIFQAYNGRIRPPPHSGTRGPVNVSVALVPQYVEGIDESESKFTVLVGVDLYWIDPRLSWDPGDFDNQSCIFVEYQEIWTPEVRFTMAMRDSSDLTPRSLCRICSEGLVHVTDFRRVSRFASFKTDNYPLDSQTLIVGFAQTSAGIQEVDMSLIPQNMTIAERRLVLPADWTLKQSYNHLFRLPSTVRCKRYELSSMNEVHPQNYAAVYCFVTVQRDPAHVIINFCIPAFVVTLLAVLAIHSAENARGPRTAKYELGLVSLMSVSVLTLSMTDSLPHSGTVSRLHIFYYSMMIAIFSSCFLSWVTLLCDKKFKSDRKRKAQIKALDAISSVCHVIGLSSMFIWFLSAVRND